MRLSHQQIIALVQKLQVAACYDHFSGLCCQAILLDLLVQELNVRGHGVACPRQLHQCDKSQASQFVLSHQRPTAEHCFADIQDRLPQELRSKLIASQGSSPGSHEDSCKNYDNVASLLHERYAALAADPEKLLEVGAPCVLHPQSEAWCHTHASQNEGYRCDQTSC